MTEFEKAYLQILLQIEKTISGALFEIADKLDNINSVLKNIIER